MTETLIIFCLAVAFGVGGIPAWCLLKNRFPRQPQEEWLMVASLALPIGTGIISLVHFAWMPLGVFHPFATLLIAMALSAGGWWLRLSWRKPQSAKPDMPARINEGPRFPLQGAATLTAALSLVTLLAAIWMIQRESPHGAWDAWAIWNVRAKFLAGGEPYWRNAMDTGFHLSHPEYPLLTSSFLAWTWKLCGAQHMLAPQLLALLLFLSLAGTVHAGLALLRGRLLASLGLLVLLSPVALVPNSAAMYADVPLASMLTASCALGLLAFHSNRTEPFALLAGFLASLCAWTKLEGLVHFSALAVGLVVAVFMMRASGRLSFRPVYWFGLGALPVLSFVALFRLQISSLGIRGLQPLDGQAGSALSLALDPARYVEVIATAAPMIGLMGEFWAHPLVLLVLPILLLGIRPRNLLGAGWVAVAIAWGTIWAGYFAIYLLNTQPPSSLMPTSFDRLLLHPWGPLVLLVFCLVRAPEDWAVVYPAKTAGRNHKKMHQNEPVDMRRGRRQASQDCGSQQL